MVNILKNLLPKFQTTWVVESYNGANWHYPIQKSALPTDNTWKYVEGYIGLDRTNFWDGEDSYGSWGGIPNITAYMKIKLNQYSNDGTVPIKYSDLRVEPILTGSTARKEEKIQIKGGI